MGKLANFFQTHLSRTGKNQASQSVDQSKDKDQEAIRQNHWFNPLASGLSLGRKLKQKKDYLLVLDIGTEFVKALVFKTVKNSLDQAENKIQGLIMGAGRQRQWPRHMQAGAVTDIEGVTFTCQKAIEQAVQMARLKPTRAILGIAGEFIKGSTNSFVYQRNKPAEEIDLAEVKNIIQKIQWKAFEQMRSQLAGETGRSEVEIRLINALITDIRIDGFQVTNPLGFQGREVVLSIFNVYAPLVQLRALENIASRLNLELLSIVAEPYALTKSLNFSPKSGAILIDIGGRTTDIALVRRGGVEGIKSFALAGQSFTKRLSQELNLSLAEAEEIKIRHSQRQLSRNVQRKIKEILEEDIRIWLTGVELVLEEFNQTESFPSSILLCGGGSLLPGLKTVLRKEALQKQWLDKFPFNQAPQIHFIQPAHINNIVDQTGILLGPENAVPIALAGLALEIAADEEKTLSSILRRVVRMMR